MDSRPLSLLTGFFAGFALAVLVTLAVSGGGAGREPDPSFDVDLFQRPTETPAAQPTRADDPDGGSIQRLIERLETLRAELRDKVAAARAQSTQPADATPPPESSQQPEPSAPESTPSASTPGCVTQHSERDGVSRSVTRCEHHSVSRDESGSVSISSSSSTSSSTSSSSSR